MKNIIINFDLQNFKEKESIKKVNLCSKQLFKFNHFFRPYSFIFKDGDYLIHALEFELCTKFQRILILECSLLRIL